MKELRKFGAAMVLAGLIAGGMMLGTARVEAKGKGGGGGSDPKDAVCAYLASVLNYPYLSPVIESYVRSLFDAYGCDPALLQ
jgi:hypothetical protein